MSRAIEVSDLVFGYGPVPVVRDVNFCVEEGEFVTLVGPNGGGKTTLLRILLGLLRPWRGSVRVFGQPHLQQRAMMGYVPQQSVFDRHFPITVEEVALMGRLKPWGWCTAKDRGRVKEVLQQVGLWDMRGKSFAHLSGGQLQRLLIARALSSDARILLLDEPSANIDSANEEELSRLLRELKGKRTILLVTHDTGFVDTMTDRVLCIHGNVLEHSCDYNGEKTRMYGYGDRYGRIDHRKIVDKET